MEILNREQKAVYEFMTASAMMRQVADDGHGKGLLDLTDALLQAIASFGVSELYARIAERCKALGIKDSRYQLALENSVYNNKKGLRNLSYAQNAFKQFRKDLGTYPKDTNLSEDLDILQRELRDGLVDLEIKASDVIKIDNAIKECFDTVRPKGIEGLADYIKMKLSELENIRKKDDRGAIENIPVWKIAAVAVALGVWVWGLFRCKWWGSCSWKEGLSYAVIFYVAALIRKFC